MEGEVKVAVTVVVASTSTPTSEGQARGLFLPPFRVTVPSSRSCPNQSCLLGLTGSERDLTAGARVHPASTSIDIVAGRIPRGATIAAAGARVAVGSAECTRPLMMILGGLGNQGMIVGAPPAVVPALASLSAVQEKGHGRRRGEEMTGGGRAIYAGDGRGR